MQKISLVAILGYCLMSQFFFVNLGEKYNNIINPIVWILLAGILFLNSKNVKVNPRKEKKVIQYSFIAILFYIILYILSGLVVSFGNNPYSNSLKGIFINIWVTGVPVIMKEISRFYIISNTSFHDRKKYVIYTVIVFSTFELDILDIIKDITFIAIFKNIIANIIPIIIKNTLFTMICTKYSYKSAIIYEMMIKLTLWISPILPNTSWFLLAILDITIPLVLLIFIQNIIETDKPLKYLRNVEKIDSKGMIIFSGVLLLAACFSIGIFPVYMKAIATGSMYPKICVGDAVIIKKCGINDLKNGDVIEYQLENEYIVHRIISKEIENGVWTIITKGDNNRAPDYNLVYEEQIKGKVLFKIKFIGWPSVLLNRLVNSNENILVETGD